MQTLCSYLIESPELPQAEAHTRAIAVSAAVREWLSQKGVEDPSAESGAFRSLTGHSEGTYSRKVITGDRGALEEVRLEELSRAGLTFATTLYILEADSRASVYATLSVKATSSVIAPVFTDPRCPSVIRKVLGLYPDWMLGPTAIGKGTALPIEGNDEAKILVAELRAESRTLPIVVVSQNEGQTVWPDLAKELAFDLTGLAIVITVDDEAAWTMTDELGKADSCYLGAVRLYWPIRTSPTGQKRIPSTVWTASTLLSNDQDGKGLLRFRATVRRAVMPIAALAVEAPPSIREIQNAASRRQLADLESRANSNSEELQLARLFIEENEQLKAERDQARSEAAKQSSRAEIAEYALSQVKSEQPIQLAPTTIEPDLSPQEGEIRFYKKTHSTPNHDVLVQVADCGHTKWQNASKADKARKGIEKLEGTGDWKSIQHCGSCKGGGVWKVRW